MKMKAAVLYKPLDIRIKEVEVPQIGAHEVLVRMKRVGICGSDVHYYLHGKAASFVVKQPLILGHECSGEIVDVGSKVNNLEIGQRVVIEPGFTCGKCQYCLEGRYNLCRDVRFYGTLSEYTLSEIVKWESYLKNIDKLTENISILKGELGEDFLDRIQRFLKGLSEEVIIAIENQKGEGSG